MRERFLSAQYLTQVVVIVSCVLNTLGGFAQRIDTIFGCDDIPPNPSAGASCTICNFDILYGTTFPFTPSVDAGWCGSVENDQYIGFVAGPTGSVVFQISTFNCINGNGVQVGVYDQSNNLVGDCFNQVFPGTPQIFTASGLSPGQTYYLRIDGFAGDGCEFDIQVISGLINQGPDVPGPIMGPTEVCWDEVYPYFIAPVANATSYYWRMTPGFWTQGAIIDPPEATNPSVGTSDLGIELEIPPLNLGMPPGTCDNILLEVFPLNPCFTSRDSTPFVITVCRPTQDTTILEVCPGGQVEFPAGSGEFFSLFAGYQTIQLDPGPNGCDTFGVLLTVPLTTGQFVDTLDRSGTYTACESGYVYPPTGLVYTEGLYYFAAGDSTGSSACDTAIALTVTQTGDPLPEFELSGNGVICDTVTSVTASILSGVPPFVFEWSTGAIDSGTLSSTVDELSPGIYELSITDGAGCTLDTLFIVETFQEALPTLIIEPTDCFGDEGSASLFGNFNPYLEFEWSTGETTSHIDGLLAGRYSVTITLPNTTCQFDTVFTVAVDTSCYAVIEGYVSSDVSFDCTAPQPTFPVANVEVVLNGSRRTFTNSAGFYRFRVDTGTYDVTAVNPYPTLFSPTCIQQHNIVVQSYQAPAQRADFYYLRDSLSDIQLQLYKTLTSIGRTSTLYAKVCSDNPFDQSVDITLTYDSDKQSVIWTQPPTAQVATNPGQIVFSDVIAPAFGCTTVAVGLRTATTANLGDTLTYFGWTDSLTTSIDATPDNNRDTIQSVVRGSFDPNIKLVEPAGVGDSNLIALSDTLLEYTIIFQNTGTDDALYVRLEDQFLPELDASTFKPLAASHPYQVNIDASNKLTVIFDDIVLPPMDQSFDGSQGFFSFQIERAPGLPEGSEITNFADIYFDFNPPIRTPTSRVMLPRTKVEVPEIPVDTARTSRDLLLYPNPAHNYLIVQAPLGDSVLSLSLLSVKGTRLPLAFTGGDATKGNQEFRLTEGRFPSGAYFARIELLAGRVEYVKVVVVD